MSLAEAKAFSDLLVEERDAAVAADVERLVAIQELKGEALTRLRKSSLPPDMVDELSARALENIALMRHLVALLRAVMAGDEDTTYGEAGKRVEHDVGNRRGSL